MTNPSNSPGDQLQKLFFCPGFSSMQWQLPIDEAFGDRVLIAWRTQAPAVEGGVPSFVAQLLAGPLCRQGTVTFAKGLRPPAGAGLVPRRWRLGRNFVWSSTRNVEEAAAGIFDEDMFSWSRQGQIVVLSAADELPALEERHLALSSDSRLAGILRDHGGRALFLPGVDGDVAGLYALDPTYGSAIRAEILDAARRLGVDTLVSDEETAARLFTD